MAKLPTASGRKTSKGAMLPLAAGSARTAWTSRRRSAGGSPPAAAATWARRRLTAPSTGDSGAAARHARGLIHEQERPFVVMVPAQIQTDRLVLALAHDARDAARNHAVGADGGRHLRA